MVKIKLQLIYLAVLITALTLTFASYTATAQTGQVQRLILMPIYHPSQNFGKGLTDQLYQQLLADGRLIVLSEDLVGSTFKKYNVKTNDLIAGTPQAKSAIQNLSELQIADFLLAVKVTKVGSTDYPGIIPKVRIDDGIVLGGFGEHHRMSHCQLEYALYDLSASVKISNDTIVATATNGGGIDFNTIVDQAIAFRDPPRFWDSRTGRAVNKAFTRVLAECYRFIPFYGEIIGIEPDQNKVFIAGNISQSVRKNDELYVVNSNRIPLTDGSTWNEETIIARLFVVEIRGNRILAYQKITPPKKAEDNLKGEKQQEVKPEDIPPTIELGMRVYPKIDRLLEQYRSLVNKDKSVQEEEGKEENKRLKNRRTKADDEAPKF